MPDIYSPALVVALVAAAICLGASILARRGEHPPSRGATPSWFRLARWSRLAASIALLAAVVSHVALGHRPGTEQSLDPIDFIAVHPIVAVIAALVALSLLPPFTGARRSADLSRRSRRRAD